MDRLDGFDTRDNPILSGYSGYKMAAIRYSGNRDPHKCPKSEVNVDRVSMVSESIPDPARVVYL